MAIMSYVEDEGPGRGKGLSNGKGLALGREKQAMADGNYTLDISGVSASSHLGTSADIVSAPTTLADGTTAITEVRNGSLSIGAASTAGGHDGSALHLQTDGDIGRLRFDVVFDADNRVKLGDLHNLSFDYFVNSTSNPNSAPVIRLSIDADGDLNTTADRGELVFERVYQNMGATPVGSWQLADLAGSDWAAWERAGGKNHDDNGVNSFQKLSVWASDAGFTPTAGYNGGAVLHFDADSVVLGWSLAVGSYNGALDTFVDNVKVGGVTYDFDL